MNQQAEQEIVEDSVQIDPERRSAVARLAFIADPAENLNGNRNIAQKRLENIVRKYSSDEKVRSDLKEKLEKLQSRGHIKFYDDLNDDQQRVMSDASVNHWIPWDVAFKDDSLSTPCRPEFDASSRTPRGGSSLNDILVKGVADLVRLLNMRLDWTMGRSAVTGDISQAYNAIKLQEYHWQLW